VENWLNRRDFLKMSAFAGAATAIGMPCEAFAGLVKKSPGDAGDSFKTIKSACRQCYGRCGILAEVKNGRVTKIQGDPDVFSEGTLCGRAYNIPQMMYNPLRITYPMKRMGERGEGKWQRITWEEAMSTITEKFTEIQKKYGGHTIIHQYGTGRDMYNYQAINRLFKEMGSTSTFGVGNLCWVGSYLTSQRIYGDETQYTGWDGQNTKCIILWSRQERSRGYYDWLVIKRAQERGVKVIAVDPRYTCTASKADVWLPIRPGSDMAMVLTFINAIIQEKQYDKEFVEQWTNGPFLVKTDGFLLRESDLKPAGSEDRFAAWDENSKKVVFWDGKALRWIGGQNIKPALEGSYLVQGKRYQTSFQMFADSISEWTYEKAAEVTWVPIERIKEAARLYIDNSPGASFCRGQKVEFSVNTSGISHAFTIMMALAGNFDVPGGQNCGREPATFRNSHFFDFEKIAPHGELRKHVEKNIDDYSVCPGTQKIMGNMGGYGAATTHAIITGKPFQPRAYWGQTSEPIIGVEDSYEVLEAFKKLDFVVQVDLYMSPTGEMADIFLPAAHGQEVDRIEWAHSGHGWPASHTAQIRQPLSKPPGECRDDIDICFDLAKRMGINMGWKDKYHFFNFVLQPTGLNFEQFRKKKFIVREQTFHKYKRGLMRFDHRPGFQTPNGKFNLYSEDLKNFGWGALPRYIEPPESPYSAPELAKDFPYILITGGRSHAYFHCEYRQSPWMREIHTYPTVDINPEVAEKHGIKNGDWVNIRTKYGKCKQRANVTNGTSPRIIHAEHDWWFPERDATDGLHGAFDSNCNTMLSNDGMHDPAIGTNNFGGMCTISKALDGPPKNSYFTAKELKALLPKGGN